MAERQQTETPALVGLEWLRSFESIADPLWVKGAIGVASALFATAPGFRVRIEGWRGAPDRPVIFAMNHTHRHDFLPIRHWLYTTQDRAQLSSWIKLRAFNENPGMRLFLSRTGNVPVGSLGYVLAGDFVHVNGRRPSEEEYRALRDHLDDGTPLPDTPALRRVCETPRALLGYDFTPDRLSYREAVRECYLSMMDEALRLARRAMRAGQHLHLYPEGLISGRLMPGRVGWVPIAYALGVKVVPVGVSGVREAFRRTSPRPDAGSEVVIRFGEPMRLPEGVVSPGFRPFAPDDMQAHANTFHALTEELMERLNALLDPQYQRREGYVSDGLKGVERFLS